MPSLLEAVKNLNEQRIRALHAANAITDVAVAARRGLTAEEQAQVDQLDAEAAHLQRRISDLDEREHRERFSGEARAEFDRRHGGPDTESARREADSLRRWCLGEGPRVLEIDVRQAVRQRELYNEGYRGEELRALLWDTGSVGSTVPTKMASTVYEYAEAAMAVWRMPTKKVITDDGDPMKFPRVNAHGIGTQVIAQGTAIGGTDPTFLAMQLDAYKYGQLVQIANEVIQDSGVDIIDFIMGNMGRAVGRVIGVDLVTGTGTAEPHGIMTALAAAGAGSVHSGGSLIGATYETLVDLVYSVNDEYRSSPSAAWLMRDASAGVIRKLRDGAGGTVGAPLWVPSLTNGIQGGEPDRLLGYPVFTDPSVASMASAARTIAFGAWNAYYTRAVGNMVIERSDDYAFNVDETTFRAKWRVDADLIDQNAIKSLVQLP